MNVGQICTRNPASVRADESILDAARKMTYGRVGAVAVTEHELLVGIISEADVVCAIVEQAAIATTSVREYMTEAPITVSVTDDVALAARYMLENGIGHLPVVDSGELVGIVTRSDLLAIGAVPLPV